MELSDEFLLALANMDSSDNSGGGVFGDTNAGSGNNDLDTLLMSVLSGGTVGSGSSRSNPYKLPTIPTGMGGATANLSIEASRNPFAIGHLMNAQGQESLAQDIALAAAQKFGRLNAQDTFVQRAQAGKNTMLSQIAKIVKDLSPEERNNFYRLANMEGMQISPETMKQLSEQQRAENLKALSEAVQSGAAGGRDFAPQIEEEFMVNLPAIIPPSVRAAQASGASDGQKEKTKISIDGIMAGPDGTNRAAVVTLDGPTAFERAKNMPTNFKTIPALGTDSDISPHEMQRRQQELRKRHAE